MDATLEGEVVRAGRQAREQFYDARGYGRPVDDGDLALAPVEAAHLLYRGDLARVDDMDFAAFLASRVVSEVEFFVYADLRDRGFYLSPVEDDAREGVDFVVYPRGKGPWDDEVAHRVRVVSERESVAAASLGECVLAVVDEESEVTYLATDRPAVSGSSDAGASGSSDAAVSSVEGELLADRVLCRDPPDALYESAFYGQRVDWGEGALQLSLVEAAYLAATDSLAVDGAVAAILERGRAVEGDRFDRRLAVYAALREAGVVPKTGFKFGADFRTYDAVDGVDDLGHSRRLVRVLPSGHSFDPRGLALDVRLAGGVRKEMVFALVDDAAVADGPASVATAGSADGTTEDGIEWLSVERLTP